MKKLIYFSECCIGTLERLFDMQSFQDVNVNVVTSFLQMTSLKEDLLNKDEELNSLKENVNQLTQDCSTKHEHMNKMNR